MLSLLQTGVMNKVTWKYNKLSIPEGNTIKADLPSLEMEQLLEDYIMEKGASQHPCQMNETLKKRPQQPPRASSYHHRGSLTAKSLINKELDSIGSWHDPHLVAEEAD